MLLYVTDIYSKYAWNVPKKDNKCITITCISYSRQKQKNFFKKYLKCLIILLVKVVLVMMDHKTTIFQLFFKSFTTPTGSNRVSAWKCKGLSQESNKLSNTLDYSLAPKLTLIHHAKIAVKFEVSCLKQDKVF